jgi:hypothetical protein
MTSVYYRGFALLKNHKKGANGWGNGEKKILLKESMG